MNMQRAVGKKHSSIKQTSRFLEEFSCVVFFLSNCYSFLPFFCNKPLDQHIKSHRGLLP